MRFSYNWIQEFINEELPNPKELGQLLALHAFEVEGVEKRGSDWIFDIAVLPNRLPDAGNHVGMAREIAAITAKTFRAPDVLPLQAEKGRIKPVKVALAAPGLVPRYSAVLLEGVAAGKSPAWLKERLESVEVNSINLVVDVTNYVMLELGQPLHAFDYNTIKGQRMRVRKARKGEKLTLLEGQEVSLPVGTLVIEDEKRLIDLAGIKGGKVSGVTAKTKNVLLQAATFEGTSIHAAKSALGLSTPAADLYSVGLDPNRTTQGLGRALALLEKLGARKVVQVIDHYPRKVRPRQRPFSLEAAERLLGMPLGEKEAQSIFKRLGFAVRPKGKGMLVVTVPPDRRDIQLQEDLAEEVGRIKGYDSIPATFPAFSLQPSETSQNVFWRARVQDFLKEAGMSEVVLYSFLGEQDLETFKYTPGERARLVELENPLSEEIKYPRPGLMENLAKAMAHNRGRSVSFFELGKAYFRQGRKVQEEELVAGILTDSFFVAKGIVEFLLHGLGIADVWFDDFHQKPERTPASFWHAGKSAEVQANQERIGFVGEVSPSVLQALKLKTPVAGFSLSFPKLLEYARGEQEFRPLSKYPASVRDLALLVPRRVKVADALGVMNAAGGALVRDIDLFDLYEGEGVPEGKKNLAFHIVYQAEDHTLTGKEVDELHEKIIATLERNPAWEVRK